MKEILANKKLKHVFGVSSHLAFYLCHKLIQTDAINADDCIFFTTRDYIYPKEYQSVYKNIIRTSYNISPTDGRVFAGWRYWETRKNVQRFDALIDSQLKDSAFVWYTQVCFNDICSLMVTKPNCVGYYIIEDGSGSYRKENNPIFTGVKGILYRMVLKPLYPRLFAVKNRMIETNHPKFKGCIASNDLCFPLHQQFTRVVGLPFISVPLEREPDAIISIDPLFLWISMTQAKEVFQRLATYINSKNYQYVVYKHHPYTLSASNHEIHQQYNQWLHDYLSIEIEELGSDVSLENTLMAHTSDFYTAVSSIAIYAKAMGRTCYSYMNFMRPYTTLSVPVVEDLCIYTE